MLIWYLLLALVVYLITTQEGDAVKIDISVAKNIIEKWSNLVTPIARSMGLQPSTVFGIIYVESRGNENAIGADGDTGLMQVTPIALADVNRVAGTNYSISEIKEPQKNIFSGSKYLQMCFNYGLQEYDALRGYNAGYGTAKINKSISADYAYRVLAAKNEFQKLINSTIS